MQRAERLRHAYFKSLRRRFWLMPAAKRADIERELAGHIELLVAEAQCAGSSAPEATEAALRQFGRPALIARRIAWEWHRENLMKTPRLVGVLGTITVLLSSLWVLAMWSMLSRILFPTDKVIILGSAGSTVHVDSVSAHGGAIQVMAGEAGIIGFNPVLITVCFLIPFLVIALVALASCIALVRRPSVPA